MRHKPKFLSNDPATPVRKLELILALTIFAAGAVDIISFVKLGGIFASAMTGNLAFLALYLARGSLSAALGSAIALTGFVAGAAAGRLISRHRTRRVSLVLLLAIETVLIGCFVVAWFVARPAGDKLQADLLIIFLSISMGLQNIAGRKIDLSGISTIVFTNTLTNIVVSLTDMLAGRKFLIPPDTGRQLISFFLYFFGALCAGLVAYFKLAFLEIQCLAFLPLLAVAAALVISLTISEVDEQAGRLMAGP